MTPSGRFGKASPEHGVTFLALEDGTWAAETRVEERGRRASAPLPLTELAHKRMSPHLCKGLGQGDQEKSRGVPAGQGVKSYVSR